MATTQSLPGSCARTPEGAQWETLALDPFHDTAIAVPGLPSQEIGNTVVQNVKKKISLTKPPGMAAGPWDCHISSLPVLTGPKTQNGGLLEAAHFLAGNSASWCQANTVGTTVPMQLGTVNIASVPAGQPTWPNEQPYAAGGQMPFQNPNTNGSTFVSYDAVASDETSSMAQLIAGGMEVHNDTAELYRQGALTAYVMPQTHKIENREILLDGLPNQVLLCDVIRQPPSFVEEAALFPNSVGLSAAQGALAPFVLDVSDPKFSLFKGTVLALDRNDMPTPQSSTLTVGVNPLNCGTMAVPTPNGTHPGFNFVRLGKSETVGLYFTGLSEETVLTLDLRFFVEMRPTPSNAMLLSLSSPSCPADSRALESYAEIRKRLPPAVPVAMNAKGDWFRMIKSVAKQVVPILTPIVGAFNPTAGVALSGANAIVQSIDTKPRAKNQSKPNNQMRKKK